MPNLKDLKIRINSVKSTQKITSAMKMVAAAKLRRAQEQAEAARPYAERMERVLTSLAAAAAGRDGAPALLAGTGKDQVHLLVVMTSDRGLCGAFNSSISRQARRMARDLKRDGKTVTPTNLTSQMVQANTDGELFWKITNGRSPMPANRVRFDDEQRWHIVAYLRTLK